MSTPNDSTTHSYQAGCRCRKCREAFKELVFAAVLFSAFTKTGAVIERLKMRGHNVHPNEVRSALWSLQSKPNPRIEVMRRGVSLWWRQITNAEGK